ncbi:hypothetical protein HK105_202248 [Polyrhizophydium stewartii]|uniref:Tyrosinase copper-binding domain-containing protein n=1 Tax=Polyrhizophydium stewartii TaxID=2732419 RepID=A0ABR4NFM0_9FUNG
MIVSLAAVVLVALAGDVAAQCGSPAVRREFRQLSESDRQAYLRAIDALKHRPRGSSNPTTWNLDQFVDAHVTRSSDFHGKPAFFPWHRIFLQHFEDALRSVTGNSALTVPYWDWTLDSQALGKSEILLDKYFGGTGRSSDHCVDTGVAKNWTVSTPFTAKCLVRCSTWSVGYSPSAVNAMLSDAKYGNVRSQIEGTAHALIHSAGGGPCVDANGNPAPFSMMGSPNDPLFFIHHSNIDRLWSRFQGACTSNAQSYDDGSASASDILTTWNVPVSSTFSTTSGGFCYTYSASSTDTVNFNPSCKASTDPSVTGSAAPTSTSTVDTPGSKWFNNFLLTLVPKALPAGSGLLQVAPAAATTTKKKGKRDGEPKAAPEPTKGVEPAVAVVNATATAAATAAAAQETLAATATATGSFSSSASLPTASPLPELYVPPLNETTYKPAPYVKVKAPPANDVKNLYKLRHPATVPDSFLKMNNIDIKEMRYYELKYKHYVDYLNNIPGYVSPAALVNFKKNNPQSTWTPPTLASKDKAASSTAEFAKDAYKPKCH